MNTTEKKTIGKMIHIYCHAKHGTSHALCDSCSELNKYAQARLSKCIYGEEKPTCQKCPVHCYSQVMRSKIKEVMRFAGPRMFFHSPVLSISHLLKGFKKATPIKKEI